MGIPRWYRVGVFFVALVAVVSLAGAVAWADHDAPTSAMEFSSSLVRAYPLCNLANANATTPGGLPACSPSEAFDQVCTMDGAGSKGRVSIKAEQSDLRIKVNIQGVTNCEGETLVFRLLPRVTADNCVDPDTMEPLAENCTVAGPLVIPLAGCVVSGGRCMSDTTVETLFPFLNVTEGNDTAFELAGCEVVRSTTPVTPFLTCGVLVP